MRASPCKDCKLHSGECHIGCKEYDDWKDEQKIAAKAKQAERDASPVLPRRMIQHIWREMKGRR